MPSQTRFFSFWVLMFGLAVALDAQGVERAWDGGVGGAGTDWFDPTNWDPDGGPDATDELTIDLGIGYVQANADVLTDSNGSITLSASAVNIGGSNITINYRNLTASNGASISLLDRTKLRIDEPGDMLTIDSGALLTMSGSTSLRADSILVSGDTTRVIAISENPFVADQGLVISDGAAIDVGQLGKRGHVSSDGTATVQSGAVVTVDGRGGFSSGAQMTVTGADAVVDIVDGGVGAMSLVVSNGASIVLRDSPFNTLHISHSSETTSIESGASITVEEGTFFTPRLSLDGGNLIMPNGFDIDFVVGNDTITGSGSVQGPVTGGPRAAINATGAFELGDAASFAGFNFAGTLDVDDNEVTLYSAGFANLGVLTTIVGGTLHAANGVALGVGDNLVAGSTVNGKVAAGIGSIIQATGDLTMGDANAFDGFFSDGTLQVGSHTVTINDRNEAVLGSLTEINGGTLTAANGFVLEFGKTLDGPGTVNGDFLNNGFVNGGPDVGNPLAFTGTVTGVGDYGGSVLFAGTFSPGLSPTTATFDDFLLADTSLTEVELGGLVPGTEHDLIIVNGMAQLDGTLDVLLIDGFVPEAGDAFDVFEFNGSVDGVFADVILPTLTPGLLWDTSSLHTIGRLSVVVPEPSSLALLGVAGCLAFRRRAKAAA